MFDGMTHIYGTILKKAALKILSAASFLCILHGFLTILVILHDQYP